MIRVGIAGGAGYVAGELLRVLINHPEAEVKYIQSESHKGEPIYSVHSDLLYCDLQFADIDFNDIDVFHFVVAADVINFTDSAVFKNHISVPRVFLRN